MEHVVAGIIGIGLAASCGFRVFVPMLIAGAATRADFLNPSQGFDWISSDAALVAFAVATLIEAVAYYVPWLDNLLDTIASPLAVIAGIVLSAAMLGDIPPLWQWSLAIIAGGGAAAIVQGGTIATRLASTVTSGGTANFVVTTLETIASAVFSVLSILAPLVGVMLIMAAVAAMYYIGRGVLRRLFGRGEPVTAGESQAD